MKWPIVYGATAYTIRYRRLTGDHSLLDWRPQSPHPHYSQDGSPWQEIERTPSELDTDPDEPSLYKHSIEGLRLNGICAVHLNYSEGSSEFFSAWEAYVWPAKGFPGEPAQTPGEPSYPSRVATFPFFGHWPDKTYSYSICAESFPLNPPGRRVGWQALIEDAAGQWDSATGLVETSRAQNCTVGEDPIFMIESLRNDVNEIFMYNARKIMDARNYSHIPEEFENCVWNPRATACNKREVIDERWTSLPSPRTRLQDGDVDIVISETVDDWVSSSDPNLAEWTLLIPRLIRFNTCDIGALGYRVRALMVHEFGHALGIAGGRDVGYHIHHPGLPTDVTVMAYDMPSQNLGSHQCSPHPLDILAIYALYQGVDR